jgi:tRNA (guanine-N7-)-methyltransferase
MARGRHPARIYISPPDEQTAAKYLLRWSGRDVYREPQRFPGLTSPDLFKNNRLLEIDFGCGPGVLACGRAQRFPEVNFLGIDKSQKPIFCAIRDAAALDLENIKFIRSDYNVMLQLLRRHTVSAAYYLFPNPPKDIHNERSNGRRRIFLQSIYAALVPGGRFFFATDSIAFFDCLDNILKNDLHYTTLAPETIGQNISTRYGQLWEQQGRSVKGVVVVKE